MAASPAADGRPICTVLEAHNLRLRGLDGSVALAGLTVFAHPGEMLAIVGGHGAGKSALLRTIAGLARPETGRVRLDGADLGALEPHERSARGIAYVADGMRVLDRLSVRDNLLLGAWRRRDRGAVRAELAEWFERFPALAAAHRRRGVELGAGQRVAAALGRAWLGRPRVLMVDEPFLGLDDTARAGVAAALRAACDAGLIVIVACHEPSDAWIAERINVLSVGRVIFSGSPAAVVAAGAAALLE
jgi:branched-chain amino acid transport system ATP-binding protein